MQALVVGLALTGLGLGVGCRGHSAAAGGEAGSEAGWRDLWNGRDLSGWDTYLGPPAKGAPPVGVNIDPRGVFSVVSIDGAKAVRISGEIFGAMNTHDEFKDFHFRIEFKWGEKKWPPRENAVSDSGILYHCVGPHGAGSGFWMKSFESQVQEGDVGDFWSVAGVIVDVEGTEVTLGDARTVVQYRKGAPKIIGNKRRIIKDGTFEKPRGQWNLVEVLSVGGASVHVANGHANLRMSGLRDRVDGREVPLLRGKIQIQSEGAEVFYRRAQIRSIKTIPPEYL